MQDLIETAIACIEQKKLTNLVRSLVDIPSTTGEERECAEFVTDYMRSIGLRVKFQEITDRRANAIGVLKGSGSGPTLMFNGHLDTARTGIEKEDYAALGPVAPGFKPKSYEKNGFIFGLGAYNMKGGVAAAITAVEAISKSGVKLPGDIIMTGVAGESEKAPVEGALRSYQGARYQGSGFGSRYLVTHYPLPDYVVVCEPTSCYAVNAQAGYYFIKVTLKGRAANTATRGPEYRGINAIDKACFIIERLREWDAEYSRRHRYDSGMDIIEPHLNIGSIEGGWPYKPSYATAICNLYADIRVTPAMNPRVALDELEDALKKIAADDPQLQYDTEVYCSNIPATVTSSDHHLIQACLKARELVVGQKQENLPGGLAPSTNDSNIFRRLGIPAVTCGPASGKVPVDAQWIQDEGERLSIDELLTATKIYVALALDICSRKKDEIN
jgi:acetylornithine deacetylase/succinyl-diaminopimelate desuccinylase-like protein